MTTYTVNSSFLFECPFLCLLVQAPIIGILSSWAPQPVSAASVVRKWVYSPGCIEVVLQMAPRHYFKSAIARDGTMRLSFGRRWLKRCENICRCRQCRRPLGITKFAKFSCPGNLWICFRLQLCLAKMKSTDFKIFSSFFLIGTLCCCWCSRLCLGIRFVRSAWELTSDNWPAIPRIPRCSQLPEPVKTTLTGPGGPGENRLDRLKPEIPELEGSSRSNSLTLQRSWVQRLGRMAMRSSEESLLCIPILGNKDVIPQWERENRLETGRSLPSNPVFGENLALLPGKLAGSALSLWTSSILEGWKLGGAFLVLLNYKHLRYETWTYLSRCLQNLLPS